MAAPGGTERYTTGGRILGRPMRTCKEPMGIDADRLCPLIRGTNTRELCYAWV
jgi:hypothetical protein